MDNLKRHFDIIENINGLIISLCSRNIKKRRPQMASVGLSYLGNRPFQTLLTRNETKYIEL